MANLMEHMAHPRSRGENQNFWSTVLQPLGSSPLTRGKLATSNRRTGRGKAHPRSRGENPEIVTELVAADGSSPLTRGKRIPSALIHGGSRLIPAHAGKTAATMEYSSASTAHPRSRGENERAREDAGIPWGSSPLTRGKLLGGGGLGRARRLIPAHAGKTRSSDGLLH